MHSVRIHESSKKELTNHVKIKMAIVFILEENKIIIRKSNCNHRINDTWRMNCNDLEFPHLSAFKVNETF